MAKIEELKFDDKNFNRHTEFGMGLLEKSLRNNGAGRSILLDKNNRIIAGNGIVEAAGSIGMEDVQIVESDGTKIIAVKRTDIDLDSKQGREMALADNATAAADLDWDTDALAEVAGEFDISVSDWGVKLDAINPDDFGDEFSLPDGDKEPFQQMTFIFADEQADMVRRAIDTAKDQNQKYDNFGNENSNGNALYYIVKQWVEQKK